MLLVFGAALECEGGLFRGEVGMNTRLIPSRIELYPFAVDVDGIKRMNAVPHGIVFGESDTLEAEACRDALRAQQCG